MHPLVCPVTVAVAKYISKKKKNHLLQVFLAPSHKMKTLLAHWKDNVSYLEMQLRIAKEKVKELEENPLDDER